MSQLHEASWQWDLCPSVLSIQRKTKGNMDISEYAFYCSSVSLLRPVPWWYSKNHHGVSGSLSLTLTIVTTHNPPIVMVEIMAAEPALHGAVTSVSFEAAWYESSTRCTFSLFGPYLVRWTWTVFASAHVA